MRKVRAFGVFAVVLAALGVFSPQTLKADWIDYGYGCWTCKTIDAENNIADCTQVDNNSWGEGIRCKTWPTPWYTGCVTEGGSCYYTETGGGSGGSGGDGSCNYESGYCPVECYSCSGPYY